MNPAPDPAVALERLWPRPRSARLGEGRLALPEVVLFAGSPPDVALERLRSGLAWQGRELAAADDVEGAHLLFRRSSPEGAEGDGSESYRLSVGPSGVEIEAAGDAGLFYGAVTLGQWLALYSTGAASEHSPLEVSALEVPTLEVADAPDFPHRGVPLDVSRDKVPTLETLFDFVDRLAGWKLNQLQLYTEHTFAYRGHETVWRGASPLTPEDMRRLDEHCRERLIELVPNQNSFGHLHRWLRHEPYRRLAEVPEGVEHAFGDRREPFSLCPLDPGSLALLESLYDQLLPCFQSRWCNVGCDETFDLGLGRSARACEERGKERVYLEFLLKIHEALARRGRRMQMWGDIVLEHPELVEELPEDVAVLAWGYEADHPFDEQARRFAEAGREFVLCPGTSGWISVGGRVPNALENLSAAARAGREHGASGLLICEWGDFGHLQPLPVAYPGLLAGAGFAWNVTSAEAPHELDLPALLDLHAFPGAAGLGRALSELGETYLHAGGTSRNGSVLARLLICARQTLENGRYDDMGEETLSAALEHLSGVVEHLGSVHPGGAEGELAVRELRWAADVLTFACRFGKARFGLGRERLAGELPAVERGALAAEIEELIRRHRRLWLARNRPGGLDDSCHWLLQVSEALGTASE